MGYCHEDCYDVDDFDRIDFYDPEGRSALRDQPCPTCGKPNRLTSKDVALGSQCDKCADRDD